MFLRASGCNPLLLSLQIQRIEVYRLQDKFGKAAFLNDSRNGLTRIREKNVGTKATDDGAEFLFLVTHNFEEASLMQFDQKYGLVAFLCVDSDGQHYFVMTVF